MANLKFCLKIRGFATLCSLASLTAFAPSQSVHAEDPQPIVRQYPQQQTIVSLGQLNLRSYGQNLLPEEMNNATIEIRSTDNHTRLACIPESWKLKPGKVLSNMESDFGLYCDMRSLASLPSGTYLVAWTVGNHRLSNVTRFVIDPHFDYVIDPHFDYLNEPILRLLQLEPPHAGQFPEIAYYIALTTQTNPPLNRMAINMADLFIDDVPTPAGRGFFYEGPDPQAPLELRRTFSGCIEMNNRGADPTKPHIVSVRVGIVKSVNISVQTTTPLADAWDKATSTLSPPEKTKTSIAGYMTTPDGYPATACEVYLANNDHEYEGYSDEQGEFYFRNVIPGTYTLTSVPKDQNLKSSPLQNVKIDAKTTNLLLSISLTAK